MIPEGAELFELMAARALRAAAVPDTMTFGTVKSYDPTTDTVMVTVYQGGDAAPQEWGPIPFRRDGASPGAGDQGWITEGTPVVVQTVGGSDQIFGKTGDSSIAMGTHFNLPTPPPFPGLTPGSFGRKSVGGHYYLFDDGGRLVSVVSTGGHMLHLDDYGRIASFTSADGHALTLDDAGAIAMLASAAGAYIAAHDLTGQVIVSSHTGAEQLIVDAAGQAISAVAAGVGLGGIFSALSSTRGAIAGADCSTFANSINSVLQTALGKFALTMAGSSIPNAAEFTALITGSWLADITNIPIPSAPTGSSKVRIAT